MQSVETMTEQILYWLSLDMQGVRLFWV